jgi:hypothetical protein
LSVFRHCLALGRAKPPASRPDASGVTGRLFIQDINGLLTLPDPKREAETRESVRYRKTVALAFSEVSS